MLKRKTVTSAKRVIEKITCVSMSLALACAFAPAGGLLGPSSAQAASVGWTPPTSAKSITFDQDGDTYRYLSAASVLDLERLEYFGVNNTVMYHERISDMQTEDDSLETYYTNAAVFGMFGSEANQNPDPYIWNKFYNTYCDAEGLDDSAKSTEAAVDTATPTAIQEGYGTSAYLQYRPDVLYPNLGSTDLKTLLNGVKTINGFKESSSDYYKAASSTYCGDENYDPEIAYHEKEGFTESLATMRHTADAVSDALALAKKNGLNLTTRYGEDPTDVANKWEMFVLATQYYIQSQIAAGKAEKKKVYYIYKVTEDGKIYAWKTRSVHYTNNVWDFTQHGSLGVMENLAGYSYSDDKVEITLEQAANADALLSYSPDNNGSTMKRADSYNAVTYATRLKNLFKDKGYDEAAERPIFTTLGDLVDKFNTRGGAGSAQVYGWVNAFLYPELINSVHMTAYYYETFHHLKKDAIESALTLMLGDKLTMPEGQSLQDFATYNKDDIDNMFIEGMKYYLKNKDAIIAETPEIEASEELEESYAYLNKSDEPAKKQTNKVTNVTLNKATVTAKMVKAAANKGATTITLGKKVKKIKAKAFKGTKVTKVVVKTTKLKKKKVKNCFKGSKVTTVQVPKAKFKAYKKIFKKKICGKKVTVKK